MENSFEPEIDYLNYGDSVDKSSTYEMPSFDPSINYNNLRHAVDLRRAKNKHSEFWHTLNNLVDGIHHYQESFESNSKEEKKDTSKIK